MRRPTALLSLVLILAGCSPAANGIGSPAGSAPPPSTANQSPTPTIHARSGAVAILRIGAGTASDSLVSVDAATGKLLARLPVGTPDRTWTAIYATEGLAGTTVLRAVDTTSGAELRRIELAGSWALPTVAQSDLPSGLQESAHVLVLVDRSPGRSASRFALVDPALATPPEILTLPGSFEFDAVGPDGRYLFLIEHVGAAGSGHYQVRAYDRNAGNLLSGVVVDKRAPDEAMQGYPMARATTADGQWAYTLYRRADGSAFVHELNLTGAYAWCVDLPEDVRGSSAREHAAWQISADSNGDGYVANGMLGFLARFSDAGEVAAVTHLDARSAVALAAGGLSGAYLLGPGGFSVLDGALRQVAHIAEPAAGSLVSSPGGPVYVLGPAGQLRAIDVRVGAVIPRPPVTLDQGIDWTTARLVGMSAAP